ncbi:MAG: hypothetical protein HZA27_02880 [Candidatus Omnitrophica bacterium]|nr:hypothetical protein [Candidatus Omnitrophota bacterium]MBI5145110.1 hypothetical protein [Candidatus Omnitrophota bacterium]
MRIAKEEKIRAIAYAIYLKNRDNGFKDNADRDWLQAKSIYECWWKRYRWHIKQFINDTFFSVFKSFFLVIFICIILSPFGINASIRKSIQRFLTNLGVVVSWKPDAYLYTQYGYEYGLSAKYSGESKNEIPNGKILNINTLEKPIWIGIFNKENISLRNVLFKIYLPKEVIPINEGNWAKGWREFDTDVGRGFYANFERNIQPNRGAHFDPPIEVKFPGPGSYPISYIYFCEDFLPQRGNFIIRVKQ